MNSKYILLSLLAASSLTAQAQKETTIYYPGEGVYIVGLPSTLQPVVANPTLVTEAYKAQFKLQNVDLASIKAGITTYNLAERGCFDEDYTTLDLRRFMGVGHAHDLTVRSLDGGRYQLGDFNPNKKADQEVHLIAAFPDWQNKHTLPLGVYDHWDCPVTYAADPMLEIAGEDAVVTVNFGNPHEGLVVNNVNFPIVVAPTCDMTQSIEVTLSIWNEAHTQIIDDYTKTLSLKTLKAVGTDGENTIYSLVANLITSLSQSPIVINTPFEVSIRGLKAGQCWLARAVDTHNLYPTHTTYNGTLTDKASDACVNVEGYFNYLGAWGWWDGKVERGECYSSGDLVQIYYDPSDPDWPGEYYTGESSFPVECTFGADDIKVAEVPAWISQTSKDISQWNEYGSVQLIMRGDALPEDVPGRIGKVVFSTLDNASQYTIYVRQGIATFDDMEGISAPVVALPATGGIFDLNGRCMATPRHSSINIIGGKKILN